MEWARILAYVTGTVDQELLARNEYLVAENRVLKAQLQGRLKLADSERAMLGEIGHRLGRKALAEVATVARPDTILAWYRKLVAHKFDGSKSRRGPGRARVAREVEQLIVRMAEENRDWGYDRIAGALANLGYQVCDQTVGNVLHRHGLPPAPERKRTTTWSVFIRTHLTLLAGTDFFTAEVLTLRGLVTYYVLFFIHLDSRRVDIAGITVHPDEPWMKQIARNVTMEGCGILRDCRYLLHDRDTKYTQSFRAIIASGQVEPLALRLRAVHTFSYINACDCKLQALALRQMLLVGFMGDPGETWKFRLWPLPAAWMVINMVRSPPLIGRGYDVAKVLSKSELIQKITDLHSETLKRKDVKDVIESLATVGHKELKKTGAFLVPGLAKFVVIKKPATKERTGINPFTKEPTVFKAKPARKIVKARPVKAVKDAL